MSFKKVLECYSCHIFIPVIDVGFPEDLYDLIIKYSVEELYWICSSCQTKNNEQNSQHGFNFIEKQNLMEKKLDELSNYVEEIKSSTPNCCSSLEVIKKQEEIERKLDELSNSVEEMRSNSSSSSSLCFTENKKKSSKGSNHVVESDSSDIPSPISFLGISSHLREISSSPSFLSRMGNYLTTETNDTLPDPDEEFSDDSIIINQSALLSPKNSYEYMMSILANKIRMDPEEVKRNKSIIKEFLEELTRVMKDRDKLFAAVFQQIYYTGSYYDGLRVSCAREFDINFVLKFPFPKYKIENSKIKGFSVYQVREAEFTSYVSSLPVEKQDMVRQIYKTFFVDGYLMPSKVSSWLQSIFAKGQVEKMKIRGVKRIIPSASGPARTMKLETVNDYEIDIDIVPVLKVNHPEWPPGADKSMVKPFSVPTRQQYWFLVPKSYQGPQNISKSEADRTWRLHFPEIEKVMLHDRGYVKPIIKLLKLLRDSENWKGLASYYLKTVVMWIVKKNPDKNYWKPETAFTRFIESLKQLQMQMKAGNIPYLFYSQYNLIEKMSTAEATNISCRLERIISRVESNYENLGSFLK